jgi:glycosyltransferase involved in cell wall biosynthesis
LKITAFVTDAFGSVGGIGKFNADFLRALCDDPSVERVTCLPRFRGEGVSDLPAKLEWIPCGPSRFDYLRETTKLGGRAADLVVCGHAHLLPFARWAAARAGAPTVLVAHGIEAWTPPRPWSRAFAAVDAAIFVSEFTKKRFLSWGSARAAYILPNSVDLARFRPGEKPAALLDRYGLRGKKVILSLGRLEPKERGLKGFEKIIGALPAVARDVPEAVFVLAGGGADRAYYERLAENAGVKERVVCTGYVSEDEKPALYRLADVYAMPSRGEGFGIVYLEALASGVPVVGSTADAGREVLRNGGWGILADPDDPKDVERALVRALRSPVRVPVEAVREYSIERFRENCRRILVDLRKNGPRSRP